MTDEQLAQRILAGETTAFDQLIDRHAASCMRFATRMLNSHEDAQEVTQDAWLRAYRALDRFDTSMPFRTWLFAILVNRCRTHLATRQRRERVFVEEPALMHETWGGSEHESWPLRVELQRALEQLSPELREAFLLKHVEQLEYTDMASLLNASVSALKMRVQRACLHLRALLQEYSDAR